VAHARNLTGITFSGFTPRGTLESHHPSIRFRRANRACLLFGSIVTEHTTALCPVLHIAAMPLQNQKQACKTWLAANLSPAFYDQYTPYYI